MISQEIEPIIESFLVVDKDNKQNAISCSLMLHGRVSPGYQDRYGLQFRGRRGYKLYKMTCAKTEYISLVPDPNDDKYPIHSEDCGSDTCSRLTSGICPGTIFGTYYTGAERPKRNEYSDHHYQCIHLDDQIPPYDPPPICTWEE